MRRSLVLALLAALVAVLTASAVTLAGDRSGSDEPRRTAAADRSERGHHGRLRLGHGRGHAALRAMLLGDLAKRLEITPAELRDALKGVKDRSLARAVERGTISAAQRDALVACLANRRTCNRRAARPGLRALRRDARPAAWADRKSELFADLAAELGRPADEVAAAVRAELVAKLDLAVTFGAVSARGRDLALSCFDAPQSCDVAALRREVRLGHGRRHGHRRGR